MWQQDPSPKKKAIECETRLSLRSKTICANSRLPIRKIVLLICFWVDGLENQVIERYLQLTTKTVCKWAEKCRQVVYDHLFSHPEKIGGPGVIVEVDESMFGRRKYHRGHRVDGHWVFGGIEANTGKSFFIPVADRKESTLIPIVKDWIKPGSIIRSDGWAGYQCLQAEGYTHEVVNHSVAFKDPETGAHTNTIESTWRHVKHLFPQYSRKKRFFHGYLAMYMFYKRVAIENKDHFLCFCQIAGERYLQKNHTLSSLLSSSLNNEDD